MSEEVEVEVVCPSCSPREEVPHDVLKTGQNIIVRCQECGTVHPATIERAKDVIVKVIISKGQDSLSCTNRMTTEDTVAVDDEIIVDDEQNDEVYPIIVTAIDAVQKRVDSANAADITTIWGRAIDEVIVKISVHQGRHTEALQKRVHGGYEFVIGHTDRVGNIDFEITKIKKRDGTFFSGKGATVEAKHVKRIFADEIKRKGWSDGKTAWSMRGKGRSW
ncbi:MAG: hypothetical protein PWP63_478 [Methanolobus sp.]|jgi:uncharacterized Zn finger protein|nr:hypothetical protein [Methanolobus sp.]